jgi:phospholipid/cholesterol/gamma-HCH transport system substrate-binding protein
MKESLLAIKEFKIGLTVFIGVAIFIFLMFIVGSESNTFASTYSLNMFLENIGGLAKGSMVSLGGLKIGSVDALEFGDQNGQHGIIAKLRVRTAYRPQITTGSFASVKTIGMLGDKYVDISIGGLQEQPLPENSFINVRATKELGDVVDQFTDVMTDIAATAKNVHAITDTIKHGHGAVGKMLCDERFAAELTAITEKLHAVASALSGRKGTLGKLINDDELYSRLNRTTLNLATISDSLTTGKGTAGKLLMSDSLYRSLESVSHRMDELLAKANSDSSSVGPFLNNGAAYQQFNAVMTNLNILISDIKENPKKYVKLSLF